MNAPAVLVAHSLRRVRTLILAMGAVLAAFQLILIVVARSIHNSNMFGQLTSLIPPFARELAGPAIASFMSFAGVVCLGYIHLVVMSALLAVSIALATVPTSEIETGFMDLILSRPLARHWIITRAIVVVIVCTAALLGMMMLGTWAGLRLLAPANAEWPSRNTVLSLAANLALLMVCWSGIAMAIGSYVRRRATAGALAGLLALASFLLDYVARAWRPAESVAWLSPFRYFSQFELLQGKSLPVHSVLILAGIGAGGFALAYLIFSRRDITH